MYDVEYISSSGLLLSFRQERANVNDEQYQLLSSSYDCFHKFYAKWLRALPYAKRFDQKVSFLFDKPDLKK